MNQINTERLASIGSLDRGAHPPGDVMCAMEAVAYVAGERWSDQPQCACPIIAAFLISWNDSFPNSSERDRLLKPLIPKIIGTRGTPSVERQRSYLALDWLIRIYTPKWLDAVPALHEHAKVLRDLDVIGGMASASAAGVNVRVVNERVKKTRAAVRAATYAAAAEDKAAYSAASAAGYTAAAYLATAGRAAYLAAARLAAAGDAAAAGKAAYSAAAYSAVTDAAAAAALKPSAEWLQASALDLVKQMIEVHE